MSETSRAEPIPSGPLMNGQFGLPTLVRFGEGISDDLASEVVAFGRNVLVLTDRGVRSTGIVDRLTQPLADAGLAVTVRDDVSPNPRDHECETIAADARDRRIEVMVAIGGGSPIDAAKCVAALVTNGGRAWDWRAPTRIDLDPLPLVAVPTTAGTGSEVTRGAVITSREHLTKFTVKDARMAPRVALVDPRLTWSVPPGVTAATGIDVLTHAVEAYTCRRASPVTDALALHAIRLVARHLAAAVANGPDAEARAGMMMASLIAGMAFSNADVAAVHCLAEALGGRYDTPHGVANAVMLPPVMRFNDQVVTERHAEIAEAMGVATRATPRSDAAAAAIGAIAALTVAVGIPAFHDLPGVDPSDFAALATVAEANTSTPSNARPITADDYEQILRDAWTTR